MGNLETIIVALEIEASRLEGMVSELQTGDRRLGEKLRGANEWTDVTEARVHDLINTAAMYRSLIRVLNQKIG